MERRKGKQRGNYRCIYLEGKKRGRRKGEIVKAERKRRKGRES